MSRVRVGLGPGKSRIFWPLQLLESSNPTRTRGLPDLRLGAVLGLAVPFENGTNMQYNSNNLCQHLSFVCLPEPVDRASAVVVQPPGEVRKVA